MTCKYIVLQTFDGERAVIFPDSFYHDEIARSFDGHEVISAGFTGFDGDGKLVCFGESESLEIKTRGADDEVLLSHQFRVSERV